MKIQFHPLLGALLAALLAAPAAAADGAYPARPVKLVVGAPPGGAPDTVARILSQHWQLGQPLVDKSGPPVRLHQPPSQSRMSVTACSRSPR